MSPRELKEVMKKSSVNFGNKRDQIVGYKEIKTWNQHNDSRGKSHLTRLSFKDKLLKSDGVSISEVRGPMYNMNDQQVYNTVELKKRSGHSKNETLHDSLQKSSERGTFTNMIKMGKTVEKM